MPPRFAVIDTNVFINGLISNQSESPPCQIVDAMLRGNFLFLLSVDLLAEYRTVLLRPKIKKLHGLKEEEIDTILTEITANGIVKDPQTVPPQGLDPKDQHVWDLLRCHPNAILITGDQALRKMALKHFTALTSHEFVEQVLS